MGQKLLIGPMNKGLRNDTTAFNIDNEAFPVLINSYQWRGRIKRKRGTELLGRLRRYFNSLNTSAIYTTGSPTQVLSGGAGNLLTGFSGSGIQSTAQIVPGTVTIHDQTAVITYTDPSMNGTLTGGTGGSINYATGAITLNSGAGNTIDAAFSYYPGLVVLGLEPVVLDVTEAPGTIAFDTTYSYNIDVTYPFAIYSNSFYENPATGIYAGYTQKSTWTPVNWNLQDYQQIWTTNYQGALWAVPGITSPFSSTNVGMQFKAITTVTVATPTTATLTITGHGLTVGDFVFVNEVATTTGINFQTGYVTTVTDANNVVVTFPNATIATNGAGGIAQYLTRSADSTKDCIRFYNGSPVTSSAIPPTYQTGKGWVNFCPPLSIRDYAVDDLAPDQYYLVGAKMVVPFKDRLLFFGPIVQASTGSPIYLQDTVIFSQNGTPYYTASFAYADNVPNIYALTTSSFTPILTPTNQTAFPQAFWEDINGYGGYLNAGYARPITSVSPNEDVLIVGFSDRQARLAYTSNDVLPFEFYIINSELGSDSTFSTITLDRGVLSIGGRGIILTSQVSSQRVDIDISDEVFEIKLTNQGDKRICAQRDFINEWIYFTYPSNNKASKFPTQTLLYNYREDTWGIFEESYTTYGAFRKRDGSTWGTLKVGTWGSWNTPWNSGASTPLQPLVIGGNQNGFVLVRDTERTSESASLFIQNIVGSVVTCPNHALNTGDYILITNALGTVGAVVNGQVYSIVVIDANSFRLNPAIDGSYTYLGNGVITRYYRPLIKTKQFPTAWEMGRKTRLGVQQYLFTTTDLGQVSLLIYLSQNDDFPYNLPPIVPAPNTTNDSLIYSTVLYTCPESTNLGLTPSNINLQIPTSAQQQQTWHRVNTSLIGDTVQVGITLSDEQMRDPTGYLQTAEIELHSFILDVSPSQLLV